MATRWRWKAACTWAMQAGERTVHYVYERDSFVPLVQATQSRGA
jgi:hypothetical protein